MNESKYQAIVNDYYKSLAEASALFIGNLLFFSLMIFCVYTGVTKENLSTSQISFCILGIICGMIVIYFGLCYLVGADKSKVYTNNVIKIIKEIKPQEDGVIHKLAGSKIILFFFGITIFTVLTLITLKMLNII